METDCKSKTFNELFANCKIPWKIVNFYFAIPSDDNCIRSPDFTVGGNKWRMILQVKWAGSKDGSISLCLERLPNAGPDTVWVNWEAMLIAGGKAYAAIESSHPFDHNSKKEVRLQSITDVLSNLRPFESDTLNIECRLIIRKSEGTIKLDKPLDPGLRHLSDDLKRMLKQKKYKDVTLKIGAKEITAHKVVLSRNKVLKCLIAKCKDDEVELQNISYESVSKLISFIYSGDMESIVANPSIAMQKCLEFFDCEDLMCCYASEQSNMHTKVEVEEHEFHWKISDFGKTMEDCICSPLLKEVNGNATWKLRLGTKTEENNGFMSLFAELVEGKEPQYLCLEFAVEDFYGEKYYPNRILRYDKRYDEMGFKEFVQLIDLENSMDSLLMDDTLGIVFKVRTSEGRQKSSMGTRMVPFITSPKELSYKRLSSEMQGLLTEGKYADLAVLVSDNENFKAHKCILSARSRILSQLIQDKSKCIALSSIKSDVFRIFLDYVYSGVLPAIELDVLFELYKASVLFAISGLKEGCTKRVLEKVTNENVDTVISMAKKLDDDFLMKAISKQIRK